jgi:hypothetical protein
MEHKEQRKGADFLEPAPTHRWGLFVHGTNKKGPDAIVDATWNERHASRASSKSAAGSNARSEITLFTKSDGPLTKLISLSADGSIKSDSGACLMARGDARRVHVANVKQLAALIEQVHPNQAIALGALRPGLPDEVEVVTKAKLLHAIAQPDVIARTGDAIVYREGQPAFALLDFDTKGMPPEVAAELEHLGGFWEALLSVLPILRVVGRVTRRSTSAGLFRSDTGDKLPGSDGLHVYLPVQDGADIPRFLKALHQRCWLAGLGFMRVGRAGQLLERSPIDHMVGRPERLVFEGGPVLDPPLQQDRKSRRPVARDGDALDTLAACPPLSIVETARLDEMRARRSSDSDPRRRRCAPPTSKSKHCASPSEKGSRCSPPGG